MAVRLKDIAYEMGVSTATVSKVLSNRKDVGEETRQRILKRIKELNYEPNLAARALSGGKSSIVGLVVPDLLHPFFAELAKSLSSVFRESHMAMLLASSEDDPELEHQEIRTMLTRGVDVLLISSSRWVRDAPYLLVDRNFPELKAHFVGSNDFKVGEVATQHLIDGGARRVAHIGAAQLSTGQERLRGYKETLHKNKVPAAAEYIVMRQRFEQSGKVAGYQAMKHLLGLKRVPDAVFCYNDLTAMGGVKAVLEAGLQVPQDIAFVGCGNFRYADYLEVPLSSVDQKIDQVGKAAAAQALDLIRDGGRAPGSILIEPKLKIRASSRR